MTRLFLSFCALFAMAGRSRFVCTISILLIAIGPITLSLFPVDAMRGTPSSPLVYPIPAVNEHLWSKQMDAGRTGSETSASLPDFRHILAIFGQVSATPPRETAPSLSNPALSATYLTIVPLLAIALGAAIVPSSREGIRALRALPVSRSLLAVAIGLALVLRVSLVAAAAFVANAVTALALDQTTTTVPFLLHFHAAHALGWSFYALLGLVLTVALGGQRRALVLGIVLVLTFVSIAPRFVTLGYQQYVASHWSEVGQPLMRGEPVLNPVFRLIRAGLRLPGSLHASLISSIRQLDYDRIYPSQPRSVNQLQIDSSSVHAEIVRMSGQLALWSGGCLLLVAVAFARREKWFP